MSKFQSLFIAGVMGLTSLSGMVAQATAQDVLPSLETNQDKAIAEAFERSDERCRTIQTLECAVLQPHVTKVYTIGAVVAANTKRPFSDILKLNGWKEGEVTPETILPKEKKFAIRGSI